MIINSDASEPTRQENTHPRKIRKLPNFHLKHAYTAIGTGLALFIFGALYLYHTVTSGVPIESQYLPLFVGSVFVLLMALNLGRDIRTLRQNERTTSHEKVSEVNQQDAKSVTSDESIYPPGNEPRTKRSSSTLDLIIVLSMTVMFAFLALKIDYLVATLLFVFISVSFLSSKVRKPSIKKAALTSLITSVVIYFLFIEILNVNLPTHITGL